MEATRLSGKPCAGDRMRRSFKCANAFAQMSAPSALIFRRQQMARFSFLR